MKSGLKDLLSLVLATTLCAGTPSCTSSLRKSSYASCPSRKGAVDSEKLKLVQQLSGRIARDSSFDPTVDYDSELPDAPVQQTEIIVSYKKNSHPHRPFFFEGETDTVELAYRALIRNLDADNMDDLHPPRPFALGFTGFDVHSQCYLSKPGDALSPKCDSALIVYKISAAAFVLDPRWSKSRTPLRDSSYYDFTLPGR